MLKRMSTLQTELAFRQLIAAIQCYNESLALTCGGYRDPVAVDDISSLVSVGIVALTAYISKEEVAKFCSSVILSPDDAKPTFIHDQNGREFHLNMPTRGA